MPTNDTVYLTPTEWQDMASGIDFSGLTNDEMLTLIANATSLVNSACNLPRGGSFCVTSYLNEQHAWRHGSRRVYLYNWPVISVDAVRLRVGANTSASINASDIYTNNTGQYIEISALALAFGVAPDIVSLGLSEPEVETDYTAGYPTIPEDIKIATAIVASAAYLNKKIFEEGTAGVVSFSIGNYMVTYAMRGGGASATGGISGYSNYVPDPALLILKGYKKTFLR